MQERVRKVDVNKLDKEQADLLSQQIGEKVIQIQKESLEKMNRILNVYGMAAELSIKIGKIKEEG